MANLKNGEDYIGITCVFFCHDGEGNFVLHKRSNNCRDEQGTWDCGSGALEFGESWEEAVKREIKEEYDTDASNLNFAGVRNVIRENNGKRTHWVAVVFAAKVDPNEVKINEPEKMDAIGWFAKDNLPEPLHSQMSKHLELVLPFLKKDRIS